MKGFLLSLVAVAIVTGMAVLSVLKTDAYVEIKNRQANIEAIADDQAPVTGPAVAKR